MPDIKINCLDCGKEFIWSEGGQRFFAEKGYTQPKRCRDCKARKKANFENEEQPREKTGRKPFPHR